MHAEDPSAGQAALVAGFALSLSLLAAGVSAAEKSVDIEWSGQYRLRAEGRFNQDLDSDARDRRNPLLQRVRLGAAVKPAERVSLFIQIQDSRAFGDEASTASNEGNLDLHQGWARLAPSERWRLTFGRQEWSYGDQRLIGAFGWDNVGRSFDGLSVRGSRGEAWVDAFWGRLARLVETGRDESARDLFGIYGHVARGFLESVEPYALAYRTGDRTAGEREGESGRSDVIALGTRAKARLRGADLTAEIGYETGSIAGDDLSAWAFAASASRRFGDDAFWLKPHGGFDFASGDADPSDGERQEFFNFFPTNHPHYGYLDLFGWRNIVSPWAGVSLGGHGHALTLKLHSFWLDEERGRWSSASGATLGSDPEGLSGSHVGNEVDVTYARRLFDALGLQVGYARFAPGEFARATRGPDAAHFAYLEATVDF